MTNQSNATKPFVKRLMAVACAVAVAFVSLSSTVFADENEAKNVTIMDGSKAVVVATSEKEPIKILETAGIIVKSNDKLDFSGFSETDGGTIVIDRLNTINVEFDGNISTYEVYAKTVGDALGEAGLTVGANDKLNYQLTDGITDGMVISVSSALSVTLTVDGKSTKYAVVEGTVEDLLKTAGVTLGPNDYTTPKLSASLKENMKVRVHRVEVKTVQAQEDIKYTTKRIKDAQMEQGKSKVITKGVNGSKNVTYNVKYVDGKEVSRETISSVVTKNAVQAVKKVGTKKVKRSVDTTPNGVKSKNGYQVGQVISGKYTHYCACATCNGNSRGITSSGKRIRNGMSNPYYIACNWLPLGTVLDVDGTKYTVVDRGGSGLSRQGRIDIFTPGGHSECYRLGTGKCTITIVRLGW